MTLNVVMTLDVVGDSSFYTHLYTKNLKTIEKSFKRSSLNETWVREPGEVFSIKFQFFFSTLSTVDDIDITLSTTKSSEESYTGMKLQ